MRNLDHISLLVIRNPFAKCAKDVLVDNFGFSLPISIILLKFYEFITQKKKKNVIVFIIPRILYKLCNCYTSLDDGFTFVKRYVITTALILLYSDWWCCEDSFVSLIYIKITTTFAVDFFIKSYLLYAYWCWLHRYNSCLYVGVLVTLPIRMVTYLPY